MNFKKTYFLLLLPLLFINCKTNPTDNSQAAAKTILFQSVLDSIYLKNPDAVGIMVHVEAPDQKISWSGAVGFSDKKQTKIQADQPALIASNTKTYVSATMLRLVEQKKLNLNDPIGKFLTEKTKTLLRSDGYSLDEIKVVHLLSHTSGIFDYVNAPDFFTKLKEDPNYRWTRDEQIALAISKGEPLAKPGEKFSYADSNYSLLTEIMEGITKKDFYTSIREVLDYKKNKLESTWFDSLEPQPAGTKPLVHQYFGEMKLDSYEVDHSMDLYGGGGIAATTKDLARFSQTLFEGKFYDDPKTLDLIYTKIPTQDTDEINYYLGLSKDNINGKTAYGHGGFWGTVVHYIPELNASVAVFILERDKRILRKGVLEGIVGEM